MNKLNVLEELEIEQTEFPVFRIEFGSYLATKNSVFFNLEL